MSKMFMVCILMAILSQQFISATEQNDDKKAAPKTDIEKPAQTEKENPEPKTDEEIESPDVESRFGGRLFGGLRGINRGFGGPGSFPGVGFNQGGLPQRGFYQGGFIPGHGLQQGFAGPGYGVQQGFGGPGYGVQHGFGGPFGR